MAYPVSAAYLATIVTSGHTAIGGVTLLAADGSDVRELTVIDGSVTEDASASVRRTLDVTIVDDGRYVPFDVGTALFPGALLRAWRGVILPGGVSEKVPLGVFVLGKPTSELVGRGSTVALHAEDRSQPIGQARLVDPRPIASGSSLMAAVSGLLVDRLLNCPPVVLGNTSDVTLPTATFIPAGADSDPWKALVDESTDTPGLVRAAGRALYFDALGRPTLAPLSTTGAARTIDASKLLLTGRTSVDPATTYGAVCVTSNGLDATTPLRTVLYSTTWVDAPWAKRVYFAQMDMLTTQDAVNAAALSLRARVTGIAGQASWTMPPDASIQAGDLLTLVNGSGGLTGTYLVQRIQTPLVSGAASVETVERAVA